MGDPVAFDELLQSAADLVATVQSVPRAQVIRTGERPPVPDGTRAIVMFRDNYQCQWCGSDRELQLDHIKPWSAGGEHDRANLRVLCRTCNEMRSNRWARREQVRPPRTPHRHYRNALDFKQTGDVMARNASWWTVEPDASGGGWRLKNGRERGPWFSDDMEALAEAARRNARLAA